MAPSRDPSETTHGLTAFTVGPFVFCSVHPLIFDRSMVPMEAVILRWGAIGRADIAQRPALHTRVVFEHFEQGCAIG